MWMLQPKQNTMALRLVSLILTTIACFEKILMTAQDSTNRPRGIFIQVSTAYTYVLPNLDKWLQTICQQNKQLPDNQRINDIVLMDLASEATPNFTMRFDVLDVVIQYVPGGSKACFGNVFLGTIGLAWNGKGNLYNTGIQDAAFRQRNIDVSRQVALQFIKRYSQIKVFHWYVSYEANLNYFTDGNIVAAYKTYLTSLIKSLTSIKRGSVMWSPTFWSTYTSLTPANISSLKDNLNSLFTYVQLNAPPGINWMNLQDSIGKATNPACTGVTSTPMDAVNLFRLVKSSFQFVSMQMNSELFKFNANCAIQKSSPEDQIQKENFYGQYEVPLGAAFEIRYWRDV